MKANLAIKERLNILTDIADHFNIDRDYWVNNLLKIETLKTALDEVDKTYRALSSYEEELSYIEGRLPLGRFRVSLPYNNPLYSLVLYSCGIALSGNEVIVRASRLTASFVYDFFNRYRRLFSLLGISLFDGTGTQFISDATAQSESGGLLFTGTYTNASSIMASFPQNQRLIYCGPGVNPFVVGAEGQNISEVVKLAIASRTYNSGQDCLCAERFLVHEAVYERFCEELVAQVRELKVGNFSDKTADIFPPMMGMQQYTNECLSMIREKGQSLFVSENDFGAVLAVFAVDINSDALNCEKFSSIFTIAKYENDDDLVRAANFPYRFGATITSGAKQEIWSDYPHLSATSTVIQEESVNAHVPFGGCGKSGFSKLNGSIVDGPILYSVESSISM